MYSRFRCMPPKSKFAPGLRQVDLAKQLASRGIAANAILVRIAPADGAPDAAIPIGAHSIGDARPLYFRKHLAVRHLAIVVIHVEYADVRRVLWIVGEPGIDDVELLLVGREGDAVRLDEIVNDDFDATGFIDPIDVALLLLGRGLDAFIEAADAVDRVGEPDGVVRGDDNVIR